MHRSPGIVPIGPAALVRVPLLEMMVDAVNLESSQLPPDDVQGCMEHIGSLASGWAALAPVAARLEEHQRAAGLNPMLTAAEMRQLCLLVQREAAVELADIARSEQQARALRRTAAAASRQLCVLQPGSAVYLLHLAKDTADLLGNTATQQELDGFMAALQAATAEKGQSGRICIAEMWLARMLACTSACSRCPLLSCCR